MALFKSEGVRIAGLSAAVPNIILDNMQNPLLEAKEAEAFVNSVGIRYIRRAGGASLSDMCLPVGRNLLNNLNWSPGELQLLIMVTQTPDYKIPPTSVMLQDKLGLPKSAPAFDINLGCSGYVYGLSVAASLMQTASLKKALLFAGDISSSCISENDRSTAPVFSDAISVTALELSSDSNDTMWFNLQSDGAGHQAIIIPEGGSRHKLTKESLEYKNFGEGISRRGTDMVLNGIEVFNFSLREVAPNIRALMTHTGITPDAVDYFVLHQANRLMNESIRKKLKLEPAKVPYSLSAFGNTSSASIPVTMAAELHQKLSSQRLSLILSGFGVGLSWGSVWLKTNNIVCAGVEEV